MTARKNTFLKTAALVLAMAGSSATANTDQVGANARLAFSDKLSMYGQRIVGSACAFTLAEAPFESRGFLAVAGLEVNRILNALENGDRALGIPTAEQDENILGLIRDMKLQWILADESSRKVLAGSGDEKTLRDLDNHNQQFMDISFRLVTAISNQYSDTNALSLTDAIRLQIAGRQRMLSQKLSYEACTLQKGGEPEVREALAETLQMYEMSAKALRDGMPEVGILPTEDPQLKSALTDIEREWSQMKWPLQALENGAVWDSTTQNRMYLKLNELMHEMDQIVVAYTKAAQGNG